MLGKDYFFRGLLFNKMSVFSLSAINLFANVYSVMWRRMNWLFLCLNGANKTEKSVDSWNVIVHFSTFVALHSLSTSNGTALLHPNFIVIEPSLLTEYISHDWTISISRKKIKTPKKVSNTNSARILCFRSTCVPSKISSK